MELVVPTPISHLQRTTVDPQEKLHLALFISGLSVGGVERTMLAARRTGVRQVRGLRLHPDEVGEGRGGERLLQGARQAMRHHRQAIVLERLARGAQAVEPRGPLNVEAPRAGNIVTARPASIVTARTARSGLRSACAAARPLFTAWLNDTPS